MSKIDYSKLRSLTASKLITALERDGFCRKRRRGSHHRYAHADGRRVTVTFHHPGQTFKIGTLQSMIGKQAQWSEKDLKRLKLLKTFAGVRSCLLTFLSFATAF